MHALDRSWLSSWIQPRHLDDETLDGYRSAFGSHPAHLVTLPNFLDDCIAARVTEFLQLEVEVRPSYGLQSTDGRCEPAQFFAAPDEDRFFQFGLFSRVRPECQISPNALTFVKARAAFADPRFIAFFERLSNQRLGVFEFGPHWMSAGDFLRPHTDAIERRRLACVLFLSPGWHADYGGALHINGCDGRSWTIDAEYNTLVVFDVTAGAEHFVGGITAAAGDHTRVTLSGWVFAPEPLAS